MLCLAVWLNDASAWRSTVKQHQCSRDSSGTQRAFLYRTFSGLIRQSGCPQYLRYAALARSLPASQRVGPRWLKPPPVSPASTGTSGNTPGALSRGLKAGAGDLRHRFTAAFLDEPASGLSPRGRIVIAARQPEEKRPRAVVALFFLARLEIMRRHCRRGRLYRMPEPISGNTVVSRKTP